MNGKNCSNCLYWKRDEEYASEYKGTEKPCTKLIESGMLYFYCGLSIADRVETEPAFYCELWEKYEEA